MRSSRAVLIARQLPFFIYARYARVPPGNARWRCPHVLSPPNSLVEKGTERHVGGHCERAHLFPSRTEQLSPSAPMVLAPRWESRSPPTLFFLFIKSPKTVETVFGLFCWYRFYVFLNRLIIWIIVQNYFFALRLFGG